MLVSRLSTVPSCLCRISRPTYLVLQRGVKEITQDLKKRQDEDEDDKPVPLSQTAAFSWKAKYNREPPPPPRYYVWYTGHVMYASLAIFMVYFCILREENDLDEIIYRPLPETIKGIDTTLDSAHFTEKPAFVVFHEQRKLQQKLEQQQKSS